MKYAALIPLLALAACATTGGVAPTDVLRYHLPDGVERGPTTVETTQAGLMTQPFEAAVAHQLGLNGYPAPGGTPSALIAVVEVHEHEHAGPPRRSPISIGIGGGTFSGGRRGGVGLGGGVDFPVGSARGSTLIETELSVLLKRRGDQTTIWEGHARSVIDPHRRDASEAATAEKLAAALFTGFPGESGRTISVK